MDVCSVIYFCSLVNCQIDRRRAIAARPRSCTLCRECIREDAWRERVALRRVKDHFICKWNIWTFRYVLFCFSEGKEVSSHGSLLPILFCWPFPFWYMCCVIIAFYYVQLVDLWCEVATRVKIILLMLWTDKTACSVLVDI